MNEAEIKVLGCAGSLRARSFNRAALRATLALAPPGMAVETFDRLGEFPLYDDDVRQNQGFPEPVEEFRQKIRAADALLIVTPEYNYSIPGVLKNAIDWASRAPDQPFEDKPIAIMSASPGRFGGARAQYHLRQCFVFLNGLVMNKPEVMIANAGDMFDDRLDLTDASTRDHVTRLLAALGAWTRHAAPARPTST